MLVTLGVLNVASLSNARQLRDSDSFALPSEVIYVPNTVQLRIMTLGYNQAAADIVWVRTLEYFARHFSGDRKYVWLEHFLNQINHLDPGFHKVYHWAGANVPYGRRFTNENVERSNYFYKAALERKPDDYEAAYRIGLNYYVEMKGKTKEESAKYREMGLSYLERAANTPGAPRRMRKLVASISSRLGKKQIALQYLIDMYMQSSDEEQRDILAQRITDMRKLLGQSDMVDEAATFRRIGKKTSHTCRQLFTPLWAVQRRRM